MTEANLIPIAESGFIPPADKELALLGSETGHPSLARYIDFVKQYGYSMFEDEVYFESVVSLPDYISSTNFGLFNVFFGGAAEENDVYSLAWNKEVCEDRVPPDLVPIGNDGGASLFCIGISGERLGKIYCWTYEEEPLDAETYLKDFGHEMPESAKYANVFLIANSFDEFWNSLTTTPPDE